MTELERIAETFDELAEANRDRAQAPDDDVNADHVAGAAEAYADAANYLRERADETERRPNARIVDATDETGTDGLTIPDPLTMPAGTQTTQDAHDDDAS